MLKSRRAKPGGRDGAILITPSFLRRHPLPLPDEVEDKEGRGRVLVVGGAPQMPGAVALAATAALRAGAGKLRIATCESIARQVGLAVPEAYVVGLPETDAGAIDAAAADRIVELANRAAATLIGPGLVDEPAVGRLLQKVLPRLERTSIVLDAAALTCGRLDADALRSSDGQVVITPHAGEMAGLLGVDKGEVAAEPLATARRVAAELGAVVALKGRETLIAAPDGAAYRNRGGNVGLATSGSGDVLAGIVAGLAARGADLPRATVWAVYLHAGAGDRLARRVGSLGFLAREVADEIPPLMAALSRSGRRTAPRPAR